MSPRLPDSLHPSETAREWAEKWCQRWFLDADGQDRLHVGGIDAGWATHVEAYYLLLGFALRQLGVPSPVTSTFRRLKAAGLDRVVRAAGSWAASLLTRGENEGNSVACILEIPTPSMTEGVLAVAAALGSDASVLAADPRALARARRAGFAPLALTIPPTRQAQILGPATRDAASAFESIRARPPEITLQGADVTTPALDSLAPLARRSAPWLRVEQAAIAVALDRHRPSTVVMASDQHRIGRLATAEAKDRGIRSIVIQHGLPQMRIGLVPVVADCVAVWSESSHAWFIGEGTPSKHLALTGNPRWASPHRRWTRPPTILVALSPTSIVANREVIGLVRTAIGAIGVPTQLVVRLHPGHRDWGWVRGELTTIPNARISMAEPIETMLASADATIVLRSTVAMDALAAGSPVILVRVRSGLSGADAELRESGLPVASCPEELARALEATLGKAGMASYFSDRGDTIARLVGPTGAASAVAALALDERPLIS